MNQHNQRASSAFIQDIQSQLPQLLESSRATLGHEHPWDSRWLDARLDLFHVEVALFPRRDHGGPATRQAALVLQEHGQTPR